MNMNRFLTALAALIILATSVAPAAQLPRAKLTITSAIALDTTAHTVTLPLYKGRVGMDIVWFILTDASDPGVAKKLGVNYAPSLRNVGYSVIQVATKSADGTFSFAGEPSFAPARTYVAGPTGFPPTQARPGGVADQRYSPFVTLTNSMKGVVFNAPIVATGDAPSDVTTHTDTEDRVVAIDIAKKTVTLVLARGFFEDKPVYYLSTEVSDPYAASVERATFVQRLRRASSAGEIPIGVVANDLLKNPPQGLVYLASRTPLGTDATLANAAMIGSPFNVLSAAPDLAHLYADGGYSPLWNVMLVNTPQDKRITSYARIAPLAKAAGFVVNCPIVAYGDASGY